jgi:hypothetical protein
MAAQSANEVASKMKGLALAASGAEKRHSVTRDGSVFSFARGMQ